MSRTSTQNTLSRDVRSGVNTSASSDSALISDEPKQEGSRARWQSFIDDTLLTWWVSGMPSFEREGLEGPSKEAISLAIDLCRLLAEQDYLAPNRVVPNGEGGVVFERWEENRVIETIEILNGRNAEITTLSDGKVVKKQELEFEPVA